MVYWECVGIPPGVCTLWYPGISIGDITRYIPWYYRYCWYTMISYLVVSTLTYTGIPTIHPLLDTYHN